MQTTDYPARSVAAFGPLVPTSVAARDAVAAA